MRGGWVGNGYGGHGCGWVVAIPSNSHMHMHMHTPAHMHAHMLIMINMLLANGNFLSYILACTCMHACVYMCVHVGTPPMPPETTTPCPLPKTSNNHINKNTINLDGMQIIQFMSHIAKVCKIKLEK